MATLCAEYETLPMCMAFGEKRCILSQNVHQLFTDFKICLLDCIDPEEFEEKLPGMYELKNNSWITNMHKDKHL